MRVEKDVNLEIGRLLPDVLGEVVRTPALAGAGDQEPVIVQAHLITANLIVSITMRQFTIG